MADQQPATPSSAPPADSGLLAWLALSAALVAMLAFAAAHVGGRAGVVCRFAPLFGLVAGAAIGWLAIEWKAASTRRRAFVAAALVAAGFVGLTLESHRLYAAELRQTIEGGGGLQLLPPEMLESIERERARVIEARSRFGNYLRHRVSENRLLADRPWPAPWPAIFWAVEIALAAVAAGWSFRLVSRPKKDEG